MTDDFGLPRGPNSSFWFGADVAGRDLFVRTMYGARTSLLVGLVASGIAVAHRHDHRAARRILRRLGRHDALPGRRRHARRSAAAHLDRHRRGLQHDEGGLPPRADQAGPLDRHRRDRPVLVALRRARRPRKHAVAQARRSSSRRVAPSARAACGSSPETSFPNLVAPIIVLATLLDPAEHPLRGGALVPRARRLPPRSASWGQILADASGLYDVAWWLMVFPGAFLVMTTLVVQPARRRASGRARRADRPDDAPTDSTASRRLTLMQASTA